uniref:P-loop containing nucleoside triphosphate hydrolase protein n=1 Tax=Angiostrongylus cantonensis TaxID=6313 RepID=A0A0K0DH43_ANGCA
MLSNSQLPKRKKPVFDVGDESDDEIILEGKKFPNTLPPQRTHCEPDLEETPEAFYSQQNHPKFYTRNLERVVNKRKAWSKPSPNVSELFFVAAAPKKFDDLAVNPRQLNKLKTLLSLGSTYGKVILITGPSGSGKTAAIDVIAKSLKLEVLKWEHSMNLEIAVYGEDRYLRETMNITEVEFYPVAATFMRKCLRRTVDQMGFRNRLFHMLGALLYAKRQNDNPRISGIESTVREELRRPPSTREINDILDMSRASADTVIMFLYEHEPKFAGTVSATQKAFEAMSVSDALSNSWENRVLGQDYSSQISARATVFYNYDANRIARGFYHYSRPKWCLLADKSAELRKEITEVMSPSMLFGTRYAEIDIPFLSLIQPSLTGSQYRLVTYLTRPWTFSWSTERALWDQRIATDPSYRMAQLRESVAEKSLMRCYQGLEESEDEGFSIEDSDEAFQSDDSFNEPVTFN